MGDLKDPRAIWAKGWLFLVLGILASGLLLFHSPSLTVAFLHLVAIWAFCRFYYFAFYVITHYLDPDHKYAGLWDFVKYSLRKKTG